MIVAAFIPRVFRRLGVGYGMFVFIAVVLTAVSTKDFVGMGRYTLAAFPCFTMAAEVLFRRPVLMRATLVVSPSVSSPLPNCTLGERSSASQSPSSCSRRMSACPQ